MTHYISQTQMKQFDSLSHSAMATAFNNKKMQPKIAKQLGNVEMNANRSGPHQFKHNKKLFIDLS